MPHLEATPTHLPYKSIAVALLFSVILGPVGVLYASFWGGVCLVIVGIVVVSCQLFFPIILLWLLSCICSVRAAEQYNKKILQQTLSAPDPLKKK